MRKSIFTIILIFVSWSLWAQDSLKTRLSISFMGDIMQHGPQIRSAYLPVEDSYDYFPVFQYIAPSIRNADIAIANLELTLAGKPYSGYPTFSAPDELALAIKQAGVDILVTANNHSLDRRKKGVERTISMLDSLQIPHTGTFVDQEARENTYPLIYEKEGVKLALLNYTYGTNGIPVTEPNIVNLIDRNQIEQDLKKADSLQPDLKIIIFHWGWEYQSLPNDEQKDLANWCREMGADMVIGSHPHVLQPIIYKENVPIVYSLGNFVSNQRDRYKDGGMIFTAEIEKDHNTGKTNVVSAGYQLTWVYKKLAGNVSEYYILPAEDNMSENIIASQDDRDKMQLFVKDSKLLFNKHNVGDIINYKYFLPTMPKLNLQGEKVPHTRPSSVEFLEESNTEKSEQEPSRQVVHPQKAKKIKVAKKEEVKQPEMVYRVQFFVSSDELDTSGFSKKYFPQIFTEDVNGMTRYLTGSFASREAAEDHLMIIINETRFKDAYVVERDD